MEDYVVRIYRRDTKQPDRLVGVVEEVGVEGRRAFTTVDELWQILTASRRRSSEKRGVPDKRYATPWSVAPDASRHPDSASSPTGA